MKQRQINLQLLSPGYSLGLEGAEGWHGRGDLLGSGEPPPAGGILQVAPVLAQKLCFNDLLMIYKKTEMIRQEEGKRNGCFNLGLMGRFFGVVRQLGAQTGRRAS